MPECAILLRPGAPSRAGEVDEMAPVLRSVYDKVLEIKGPGHIEGGDILTTATEILVGLFERTDTAGVKELSRLVAKWGYEVRTVNTPKGILHFKTDCALLDSETILSTKLHDASGRFAGYRVIHSCENEEAAANAVRFNQFVLMPAIFPKTAECLRHAGYDVREINNTECAKLDGGISLLSLRF